MEHNYCRSQTVTSKMHSPPPPPHTCKNKVIWDGIQTILTMLAFYNDANQDEIYQRALSLYMKAANSKICWEFTNRDLAASCALIYIKYHYDMSVWNCDIPCWVGVSHYRNLNKIEIRLVCAFWRSL